MMTVIAVSILGCVITILQINSSLKFKAERAVR